MQIEVYLLGLLEFWNMSSNLRTELSMLELFRVLLITVNNNRETCATELGRIYKDRLNSVEKTSNVWNITEFSVWGKDVGFFLDIFCMRVFGNGILSLAFYLCTSLQRNWPKLKMRKMRNRINRADWEVWILLTALFWDDMSPNRFQKPPNNLWI